jgi:glycerophosphoryl diester phosphodiesterase
LEFYILNFVHHLSFLSTQLNAIKNNIKAINELKSEPELEENTSEVNEKVQKIFSYKDYQKKYNLKDLVIRISPLNNIL